MRIVYKYTSEGVGMYENEIINADCLEILKNTPDNSIDLIATDPPFNKGYDMKSRKGAFTDTWVWDTDVEEKSIELKITNPSMFNVIKSARGAYGDSMGAFLYFMGVRLIEMKRVLQKTGSMYLHCDATASHYLKVLMDTIFGIDNFRNEIVWKRSFAHNDSSRYGSIHDIILFYTKSDDYMWNRIFMPYEEAYIETFYKKADERGRYCLNSLTGPSHGHVSESESSQAWRGYDPKSRNRVWSVPRTGEYAKYVAKQIQGYSTMTGVHERLDALDKHGFIIYSKKVGSLPRLKLYLDGMLGVPLQDMITDIRSLQGFGTVSYTHLTLPTKA